jgi:orotate phosphoribosyltransferase
MPAALPTAGGISKSRPTEFDVMTSSAKDQLREMLSKRSVCRGDFTLASGAKSDFYVDAKLTTSDPDGAILVGLVGWQLIRETAAARNVRIDSIGGLTMGADWVALSIGITAHLEDQQTAIQIFSVRKSAKEHGRLKRIEGNFSPGHSVVVVDDVITTGGSTIQAIDAIEEAGGHIAFVIVLVDRQEGGRQAIEQRGHQVIVIFNRSDLESADAGGGPNIGAG